MSETDFTTQPFQPLRPSKDFNISLHSYIFVYSTDILGLSSLTPCEPGSWYVGQDRACQWLSLRGKSELERVCPGVSPNVLQDPASTAPTAPVSMTQCFPYCSWAGSLRNTEGAHLAYTQMRRKEKRCCNTKKVPVLQSELASTSAANW